MMKKLKYFTHCIIVIVFSWMETLNLTGNFSLSLYIILAQLISETDRNRNDEMKSWKIFFCQWMEIIMIFLLSSLFFIFIRAKPDLARNSTVNWYLLFRLLCNLAIIDRFMWEFVCKFLFLPFLHLQVVVRTKYKILNIINTDLC